MARANNGGWDFVKVGGTYQVKEDHAIYGIRVLEDKSTSNEYIFVVCPTYSNVKIKNEPFVISSPKNLTGMFSGMLQIYEHEEYMPLPIGTPWPFIFPE